MLHRSHGFNRLFLRLLFTSESLFKVKKTTIVVICGNRAFEAEREPTGQVVIPGRKVMSSFFSNTLQCDLGVAGAAGFSSLKLIKTEEAFNVLQGHIIAWPDFLAFLADAVRKQSKGATVVINGHYHPMYKVCQICGRQYDYILKAETSDEDFPYLMNFLPKTIELSKFSFSIKISI